MGKQKEHKAARAWLLNTDAAQGMVEAIVSVFGVLDDGDDIIEPGAYTKTLSENAGRVKVLDQHNSDSVLRVVGKVLAMREVGRGELPADVLARFPSATGGLWTQTQYLIDTPEGKGVFDRIAAGAVNEYSIGYTTIKSEYRKATRGDGTPVSARILKEVRLWEYSPVIFGMNPATATVGVKGAPDDENEEDTLPIDAIVERKYWGTALGGGLQAEIVSACRYWLTGMLAREVITPEEYRLVTSLLVDAALMVYNALPEDLRARTNEDDDGYMSAGTPDEAKAGRVLSARNYDRIQQAHEALAAVMSDAGMVPDDTGKNASAGGDAAHDDAERKDDATHSAEPGIMSSLTLAGIERELLEFELALWESEEL